MKPVKLYMMYGGFVVAFAATTQPEYALAPSGETAADDRPRVEQTAGHTLNRPAGDH